MSSRRWSKFWWQDWQRDPALRSCSLAARGAWMDLLCIAHEGEPAGHVTINGRAPSMRQIGAIVGVSEKEASRLIDELETAGVFSRTSDGVIYSRRMVRDHEASEAGRENVAKRGDRSPPGSPPTAPPNRGASTLEAEAEAEAEKKEPPPPFGRAPLLADAVASPPVSDAFDAWNALATEIGLPTAETLNKTRRKRITDRLRQAGMPGWMRALEAIRASPFLRGENDRGWRADLDFVCQSGSFTRIIEGSYSGSSRRKTNIRESMEALINGSGPGPPPHSGPTIDGTIATETLL